MCAVVTALLTALTLRSVIVTGGIVLVGGGYGVAVLAMWIRDPDRPRRSELNDLVRQIENGQPPGIGVQPKPVEDARRLAEQLEELLAENDQLCVIRLHGKDILDPPPGIAEDAIPVSIECLRIVGAIGWKLEKAEGLDEEEKEVAEHLRSVVSFHLQEGDPLGKLRQDVVAGLKTYKLTNRLVPLVDARQEALGRREWAWLKTLFEEMRCKYGVFQEPDEHDPPPFPVSESISKLEGQRYVSGVLSPWVSEDKSIDLFASLCAAVGGQRRLDLKLLKIRCAVIAVAADLDQATEPMERLLSRETPPPETPEDRAREAVLEVRWLIDRKAALIAGTRMTGAFDTMAVSGTVTSAMFGELMKDLGLDEKGAGELYGWLRSDELRLAEIIDSTEDEISLGAAIQGTAKRWLEQDQQSEAYQIAAERYYRVCLVMNRTYIPPGYEDWAAPKYGGLHLFETADWWKNVHTWCGHLAKIDSPEHRGKAAVAITCLFIETWWWWGDHLRLKFIDDVLALARMVLRDQPDWISALEEFNGNYVPSGVEWNIDQLLTGALKEYNQNYVSEADLRARAGDRWRHVANALGFIADRLGLRQGNVPGDPVLARIYLCWCFFSGDVAQQAGRLETADGWFCEAARACGDVEANTVMRAFAWYQRADTWIPSDTDRSLRLIRETDLANVAVHELEDRSLTAYVARMYGDIRWQQGNIGEAFDAYGRTLLLTYVYQVDQESEKMPPNAYCFSLYNEMRNRFLRRLDEARDSGHAGEADAAVERITKLFGPYWELKKAAAATVSGEDPLAGVPPLPAKEVLGTFDSDYARDARKMLDDKLKTRIAEPVDQPL